MRTVSPYGTAVLIPVELKQCDAQQASINNSILVKRVEILNYDLFIYYLLNFCSVQVARTDPSQKQKYTFTHTLRCSKIHHKSRFRTKRCVMIIASSEQCPCVHYYIVHHTGIVVYIASIILTTHCSSTSHNLDDNTHQVHSHINQLFIFLFYPQIGIFYPSFDVLFKRIESLQQTMRSTREIYSIPKHFHTICSIQYGHKFYTAHIV